MTWKDIHNTLSEKSKFQNCMYESIFVICVFIICTFAKVEGHMIFTKILMLVTWIP